MKIQKKHNILDILGTNKLFFILSWFLVFFITFGILSSLGLVPNFEDEPKPLPTPPEEQNLTYIEPALPTKIVISKIGVDIDVVNPESNDINVLDQALNSGVVRYSTSGLLGERANMLLFGHSSYLPVVKNKAYKAFNKLEKLEVGDKVNIFSDDREFIYEVFSVRETGAADALIGFETNRRMVTLSTCDNFGDLDDRFIVEAELIAVREI
jgi:LPXTG-site transpeptidase (sortase) family protein